MVLGKPFTNSVAKEYLEYIRGMTVDVISGLYLCEMHSREEIMEHVVTKVHMANYSDETVDAYVATGEPLDKAGAFGIQEKGAVLVEKIDGCYFNVMGLPLYQLSKSLEKLGVNVLDYK